MRKVASKVSKGHRNLLGGSGDWGKINSKYPLWKVVQLYNASGRRSPLRKRGNGRKSAIISLNLEGFDEKGSEDFGGGNW